MSASVTDDPSAATLVVSVLGVPSLVVGGVVSELRGRRQASLLALFACRLGMVLSRETIEDELWGGRPVSAAALRVNVLRLREHFAAAGHGDPFRTTTKGYALDLEPEGVDAARFAHVAGAAISAHRRGDLALAVERADAGERLWRGPAFHGVDDVPAIEAERGRLSALRHDLRSHRVAALIELGRPAAAVDAVDVLLADDPYREASWALRMIALYRDRRQREALATYRRLERMLAADLGIRPSPELQALERELLEQRPAEEVGVGFLTHASLAVRTRRLVNTWSGRSVPLVGRDELVEQALAMLRQHRFVTLFGLGGAGKTRVAQEIAHRLTAAGQKVGIVDLTTIGDGALVPMAIATGLGLRLGDVPEHTTFLDQVADALRRAPAVLVLDNAEHVIAGARATIEALATALPGQEVLVTSRQRLGTPAEVPLLVPPLTVSDEEEHGGHEGTAVQLLVRLLGDRVRDDDLPALSSIARSVGGLPLGLELAATMAKVLPVADVAGELARRGSAILDDPGRGSRQRSIDAVLAWTEDQLSPVDRQAFRRLSAMPAWFSLATATSVADIGGASLLPALGRLIGVGLVEAGSGSVPARYRVPFLQRSFGRAELRGAGEEAAVEDRLINTMVAMVEREGAACRGSGQRDAFRRVGSDLDTLRDLLHRLPTTDRWEAAADLAAGMTPFWFLQGYWAEGARWGRRVLDHAPAGQELRCAKVVVGMAEAVGTYGGMARLVPELHQAVAALDAAGETAWAAAGHLWLAVGSAWNKQGRAYHEHLDRARELAAAGDVGWVERVAQRTHGLSVGLAGDPATARRLVHRATRASMTNGDEAGAAVTLLNLGMFLQRAGEVRLAREDLAEATSLAAPLGMGWLVAHAHYALAEIAAEDAEEGAIRLLREVREEFLDLGDLGCANGCSRVIAAQHLAAGDLDAALVEARTVLERVVDVDDQELAMVLAVVAETYRRQGRIDDARSIARAAVHRSSGSGIGLNVAQRRSLDDLAVALGLDGDTQDPMDADTVVDLALA